MKEQLTGDAERLLEDAKQKETNFDEEYCLAVARAIENLTWLCGPVGIAAMAESVLYCRNKTDLKAAYDKYALLDEPALKALDLVEREEWEAAGYNRPIPPSVDEKHRQAEVYASLNHLKYYRLGMGIRQL
jgi:hypothetical protein